MKRWRPPLIPSAQRKLSVSRDQKKKLKKLLILATYMIVSPFFCSLAKDKPKLEAAALEIQARDHQAYKMKLLVGVIGKNERVQKIADVIKNDVSLSLEKQTGFDVTIQQFAQEPRSKKEIKTFFNKGYSLVVFLSAQADDDIMYRLYDATQAAMVHGKRVVLPERSETAAGHHVASLLMQQLVGTPVQFGAQLAFCKKVSGKQNKQIFLTNPHAAQTYETLLHSHTPKCGLRWHAHDGAMRLYYSEQSPVNVRLMSYDMTHKRTKLIMNFDGLNMQPSFSEDGSTVIVCCSQAGSSQLYKGTLDQQCMQWNFKRLTRNRGNNISPHLCKNGDIIFCSDFQTRQPQLYRYRTNGSLVRLTNGGYCACPAVQEDKGVIAFIKLINGVAQLCLFDIKTKKYRQLTFDNTHKDEPTWSPCGAYLAYTVEQSEESSRIAVRNMTSSEVYFVTAKNEQCSNPAWSPVVM